MFEAITFSRQNKHDPINPLDMGYLVECMLFYTKVTVVADQSILKQLILYFGIDKLLILINEEILSILLTESVTGIYTTSQNNNEYHSVTTITPQSPSYQDKLRMMCIDITGKSGKGRRLAQKVEAKIKITKHDKIILDGARRSILDNNYVEQAAKIIIKELVPDVGDTSKISFVTELGANGIEVVTNIDFTQLNHNYHKRVSPEHSSITPAFILSNILDMEAELYFASTHLSELAASALSAKLGEQKIDYLISKSKSSSEKLGNFTGFYFKDAKAIREAVNSNRVNVDDLIAVLLKSVKFKKWIIGQHPDDDLIKNYYEEVTRKTFVNRLPGKTVRWFIFTTLGLAAETLGSGGHGIVGSIAVNALDTFYMDKLIHGWKPNHFIDEDVKKLIREEAASEVD